MPYGKELRCSILPRASSVPDNHLVTRVACHRLRPEELLNLPSKLWANENYYCSSYQVCGAQQSLTDIQMKFLIILKIMTWKKRFSNNTYCPFLGWGVAFLVAQTVRILLQCERPVFNIWVGTIPWRRAWQSTPVFMPGESAWTEVPGRLQSMGSQRVGHDWENKYNPLSGFRV